MTEVRDAGQVSCQGETKGWHTIRKGCVAADEEEKMHNAMELKAR
jgi:hypothetical protein